MGEAGAVETRDMDWVVGPGRGMSAGRAKTAPRRLRLAALCVLGLASALLTALALGFVVFVNSLDRAEEVPAGRADAIVVLTGGSQRIGDAIDLLAKGYGARLLISGVNEKTSRGEIARLNPGQRRLFACCVDLDYRARNTIGNAIETRRWLNDNGFSSVIVVTSNYHMPRTMLELDNALPEIRKVPYAVVPTSFSVDAWWYDPMAARILASEYLKFLVGYLRTLVESDPEMSAAAVMLSRFQAPVARASMQAR